jgi:HlyD family secretion protein
MDPDTSHVARISPSGMGVDIQKKRKPKTAKYVGYAVAAAVILGGATFGLSRLRAAAPTVDPATVWSDTVKRGGMVRQVQGQGTLVPEEIRWISAPLAGRVEKILLLPGSPVAEDTILVELSNPDVQLQALEAERQVAEAEAQLTNLHATLDNQSLAQESTLATLKSDLGDAQRRASADQELANKGFLSNLEMEQSRARQAELKGRLEFENKRLGAMGKGKAAQVEAQKAQVERLRSIAKFRHQQVEELKLRAGVKGVLQELPFQVGQSVPAAALVAKVVRPDKLKAELRVPETQAKDVLIGQKAVIDTRNGEVIGKVMRIDPASVAATVRVDVRLEGELPKGSRPDLTVEGTIELERLENVLYVGRPAFGQPGSSIQLFKMDAEGTGAQKVTVQLGKTSVKTVEIVSGLAEGDKVILSDMSQWDSVDRIRLR